MGESALLVSEELALQQRLHEGGAAHLDIRPGAAGRVGVQGVGGHLLAGPALAVDHDRGVARRDAPDRLEDLLHRRAAADELAARLQLGRLLHLAHALGERAVLQGPADGVQDVGQVKRFGDIVVGALLDGLNRRAGGIVGRHDQHRDIGCMVVDTLQRLHPTLVGHTQVHQDHVRRFLLHGRQHLAARLAFQHAESFVAQVIDEQRADGVVVVDDVD